MGDSAIKTLQNRFLSNVDLAISLQLSFVSMYICIHTRIYIYTYAQVRSKVGADNPFN